MSALPRMKFQAQGAFLTSPQGLTASLLWTLRYPAPVAATAANIPIAHTLHGPQGQSFTNNVHPIPIAIPRRQVVINTCNGVTETSEPERVNIYSRLGSSVNASLKVK